MVLRYFNTQQNNGIWDDSKEYAYFYVMGCNNATILERKNRNKIVARGQGTA
jgi:hypothetical protein